MSRPARRLYEILLRAYPGSFRRRYREELTRTFLDRLRTARGAGPAATSRLWAREVGAALAALLRLGGRPRPAARARPPLPGHPLPELPLPRKRATHMSTLLQDLRHAGRALRADPGFTAVAALAIALGVGATTAIFSVVDGVLLSPLPYPEPERLVSVWEQSPERDWYQAQVAAANYLDWREQARSFSGLAAHEDWLDNVTWIDDAGDPVSLETNGVTGNYFSVLGVEPMLGGVFSPEHDWSDSEPAVVLSHASWTRHFDADPGVVGTSLVLDGLPSVVLGVMGPDFHPPRDRHNPFPEPDLWSPVRWDPGRRQQVSFRRAHGLSVIGRLAPGATLAGARAEIETIMGRLAVEHPETNADMGAGITPLHDWVVDDARLPLSVLLAGGGLLLLIACVNVANMLLARAGKTRGEMAVRAALGAGPARLIRLGLAESLGLALVGGGAGALVALWSTSTLLGLVPAEIPRLDEVGTDLRVLGFAVGLVAFTGVLFGALPALRAARPRVAEALEQGDSRGGGGSHRTSHLLVVAEVALAVVLVVSAGLLGRSFLALTRVDPGFDPEGLLVAKLTLPRSEYDATGAATFWAELPDRLRELPGVESAAASSRLPFSDQRWSSNFTAEGWPPGRYGANVRHDEVTPGFFETFGIPLLRGRGFEMGDAHDEELVVVINRTLAERYFPDSDPVGRRVTFDGEPDEDSFWRTIVGVVDDVRRESLGTPEAPGFYAPVIEDPTWELHLLLRTRGEPTSLVGAVRRAVREIDPTLPLHSVTTMQEVVDGSLARDRLLLVLLGSFGGVALVLAAVGVYGVVSYSTSRRTREIGVRMALGARGGEVVRMVLGRGMLPVAAGLALGVGGALLVTRTLSTLLYGVSPLDPATFAAVPVLLGAVGAVACLVPARRATRIDPTRALRGG